MTHWRIHDRRTLYESDSVGLELADVELPDGTRLDHHVIRSPFELVCVVVDDRERGVLLLHRHRFIVDQWTWDVPAGKVAPGEAPADAAVRAAVEETGWRPRDLREVGWYHPLPGISDQRVGVFRADGADHIGEPNPNEAERVEWIPREQARTLVDGLSLTAVLWTLR